MKYIDTVNWMFQQLPMYQNKGKSAFKKDLSNTIKLSVHLNHPEQQFKSIRVQHNHRFCVETYTVRQNYC